jgi:hypothetical protein
MNIGFDVSQTGRLKAGCGYLAESLIRHLAEIDTENQYILYPTFGDVYCDPEWPAAICRIDRPNFRQGLGHKAFESAQRFWRQPPGNLEEQLGNPDIVHSNNFYCPTTLRSARLVYTLYDLGFIEYPEFTTEENRIGCFRRRFPIFPPIESPWFTQPVGLAIPQAVSPRVTFPRWNPSNIG